MAVRSEQGKRTIFFAILMPMLLLILAEVVLLLGILASSGIVDRLNQNDNDTLDEQVTNRKDRLQIQMLDMSIHLEALSGAVQEAASGLASENELDHTTAESLKERLMEYIDAKYAEKEAEFGDAMRDVERVILLRVVDEKWMEHIDNMEQLRQGINLRAYAQRDPVVEYKFEAMDMFDEMISYIKEDTVKLLFHVVPQNKIERVQVAKPVAENLGGDGTVAKKPVRKVVKIGRNEPCPCGSGKKYKNCCLGKDEANN